MRRRLGRTEAAAALAYAALFVAFYPPALAIIDESTYLSTAYVYRQGTVRSDVAGVASVSRVAANGHEVSKFAPLWPAVLVPFTAAGWSGVFAANLAVHLAGFAIFALLIRRANAPPWWSLLYLAHPTLVYYSRTLMSDTASGVVFLAAWACWTAGGRRSALWAGVLAGVSCGIRTTNAVLVGLLACAAVVQDLRRDGGRERSGRLVLGVVPPALLLAAYNQLAFGKWWRGAGGYRDERAGIGMTGQFSLTELPLGLAHYVSALTAVLPLMLPAALLYRGRDAFVLRVVALGFTLFFSFYYYRDTAPGVVATWIVGLRFLIPVLPLFLLAYVDVLRRRIPRTAAVQRAVAGAVTGVAIATVVAVSWRHQEFLRGVADTRDRLYAATSEGAVVLCDTGARKLLHDAWGDRHPVRVEFRGRWEIPDRSAFGGRPVFVAMAGRGLWRESAPEMAALLGAHALPREGHTGSSLRVWALPSEGGPLPADER